MARVTVEDCLKDVDNLFQLVLIASKRARQIYNGSSAQVPLEGDKPTVLALREISKGFVGREILQEKREEIVIDDELLEAEMASVADANSATDSNPLDPAL